VFVDLRTSTGIRWSPTPAYAWGEEVEIPLEIDVDDQGKRVAESEGW